MGYAPAASPQNLESEAASRNRKTPKGTCGKSDIAEEKIMRNTSNKPNKTCVDFHRELQGTKQKHPKSKRNTHRTYVATKCVDFRKVLWETKKNIEKGKRQHGKYMKMCETKGALGPILSLLGPKAPQDQKGTPTKSQRDGCWSLFGAKIGQTKRSVWG